MKHFAVFDNATFTFLLRLRTYNAFWFEALVRCAKKNPKLAKACLNELIMHLKEARFDISNVNVFQVSHAANKGLLETGLFDLSIKLPSWTEYLANKQANHIVVQKHLARYEKKDTIV